MKKYLLTFSLVSLLSLCALSGCGQKEEPPIDNPGDDDGDNPKPTPTPDDEEKPFSGTLAKGPTLPQGEKGIAIRYKNPSNKYDTRALWVWENNGSEGEVYTFSKTDDFGAACFIPLSKFSDQVLTNGLGVIMRPIDSWDGQSADLIVNFSNLKADEDGYYNIFLKQGIDNIFDNPDLKFDDIIKSAKFTGLKIISVETTNAISAYSLYKNDTLLESKKDLNVKDFRYTFESSVDISADYKVDVTFKETGKVLSSDISKMILFNTDAFNETYYYEGELGAIYTSEKTTFKVWSPFSSSAKLRLYNSGTPKSVNKELGNDEFEELEMKKGEKGVFEIEKSGDLQGKYYTYIVTNSKFKNKEVVDPYAKSTGINGLRGMIVDFNKTNPNGWENVNPLPYSRTELAIYETHVADVTSSSSWGGTKENAKKYSGLIEENTKLVVDGNTFTTGFDHIKELGINAVQLISIFDQANDELATDDKAFNRGYNPLNYNSLDGIYSKNPYDGYQKIKEFKEVVQKYNEANINIIMDVVYNHVNSAKGSNFDVLMPDYYFRYAGNGMLSNGSGCGNEFASEKKMARKFIVDSTEFWAKEYKLGGFRFDLMALHDMKTMNEVAKNIKEKVNPNIFIHGEPWAGGSTPLAGNEQASQSNLSRFEGYGAFNDKFRDGLIKGGLSVATDKGRVTDETSNSIADYSAITSGIKGQTGTFDTNPLKTTNYVTCHDNYTLYDRIKAAGVTNEETIKKMATLANAVVFTSQGTSFMLAGEEFLRTKDGDHDSYNSGYKINELDYTLKSKNSDVFDNYKKLIELKTKNKAFQLTDYQSIRSSMTFDSNSYNNTVIDYKIVNEGSTYRVIHTSLAAKTNTYDFSNYDLILDTSRIEVKDSSKYEVAPGTTIVLIEK